MSHPLNGAELRLWRAERHLTEAQDLIRAFSKTCEDNAFSHDNFKTLNLGKWPDLPPELSLAISDAIHNFRAALDYIVYELAIKDSGKPQDGTQFLIVDAKVDVARPYRGFDVRSKKDLIGLTQRHVDMIEAFQPYERVKWTKTLRDISNPDKHRTLTVLSYAGRSGVMTVRYSPGGKFQGAEKLTVEGPVFDRYDIEFDASHAIAIAGRDPKEPPIMSTLYTIQLGVDSAINEFKSEF